MRVFSISGVLSALVVLVAAGTAHADKIRVPQDAPDLAAAVALAEPGDTILLPAGTQPGGVVIDGATDLTIKGKSTTVLDANGGTHGLSLLNCSGVTVSRVGAMDATVAGFGVEDSDGVRFVGCHVDGGAGRGFYFDDTMDVRVDRCVIDGVADTGLLATGGTARVVVTRTTVSDVLQRGILVHGDDSEVSRCTVNRSGGTAFETHGERSPIDKCRVNTAGGEGAQTFGNDSPVLKTRVNNTTGEGIQTFGDNCAVIACRAEDTQTHGIQAFDPNSPVENCKVNRVGRRGIGVTGGNSVSRCKVSGAGEAGVWVSSAGSLVEKVKIKGSTLDGLFVLLAGNEFVKVKVSGSGGLDIVDQAGAASNTYTKCKFGNASPP